MKYLILAIAFISLSYWIAAQPIQSSFTINGRINADSGEMILMPITDSSYYPLKLGFQKTTIVKGKFIFKGRILYPYAFQIGLKTNSQWKYISNIFFIEPGEQRVTCNVDSLREIPNVRNKTMEEFKSNYINSMNDSMLLKYTKEKPNSYAAMWRLVNFMNNGYKFIYSSIYENFSYSIKRNFTGKALARKLYTSKVTSIGSIFPVLQLLNKENIKVTTPAWEKQSKFTLVDFWFSHCGPCLSQFKELKIIYKKYKRSDFEIVGISIDTKDYVNDWKKVVKKQELPWKQYLDLNAVEANKLSLKSFPSNFLIDDKGKIIAKDITPKELNSLLQHDFQ
jgi:thiol-disulfide isomerase/thioredoxin